MKTNPRDDAALPVAHTIGSDTPTAAPTGYTRTVHHDGNQYFATHEMAEIFRARASQTAEAGETELVPLLHSRGVELLLISPRTVFAVVTIEVGSPTHD